MQWNKIHQKTFSGCLKRLEQPSIAGEEKSSEVERDIMTVCVAVYTRQECQHKFL